MKGPLLYPAGGDGNKDWSWDVNVVIQYEVVMIWIIQYEVVMIWTWFPYSEFCKPKMRGYVTM